MNFFLVFGKKRHVTSCAEDFMKNRFYKNSFPLPPPTRKKKKPQHFLFLFAKVATDPSADFGYFFIFGARKPWAWGTLRWCLAGSGTTRPSGLMMEHNLPPLPPLSFPGCRASQPLASHHHFVLCPHHHHLFHHDCHNHHQHRHSRCQHHHLHYCHHFFRHHNSVCHHTANFHLNPCSASSSSLPPPAVSVPGQPYMGDSVSAQNHQNMGFHACKDAANSGVELHEEWNEELEEEEEEEPVFVMTDEWMEFFARSEAKRKLEKKQAKKNKAKK